MMDLDLIERLMILLEKSELESLDVTENGVRVRLSKKSGGLPDDLKPASEAAAAGQTKGHVLVAGLTGTFYRAPAPGAEPFAKVGDMIIEGQVLGLVEAMKMLNPIEADRDGMIVAILAEDGQSVLQGAPLIRLGEISFDV
jgi:acetyl-CoA carboxylase biotin carboxyl carrier protein